MYQIQISIFWNICKIKAAVEISIIKIKCNWCIINSFVVQTMARNWPFLTNRNHNSYSRQIWRLAMPGLCTQLIVLVLPPQYLLHQQLHQNLLRLLKISVIIRIFKWFSQQFSYQLQTDNWAYRWGYRTKLNSKILNQIFTHIKPSTHRNLQNMTLWRAQMRKSLKLDFLKFLEIRRECRLAKVQDIYAHSFRCSFEQFHTQIVIWTREKVKFQEPIRFLWVLAKQLRRKFQSNQFSNLKMTWRRNDWRKCMRNLSNKLAISLIIKCSLTSILKTFTHWFVMENGLTI